MVDQMRYKETEQLLSSGGAPAISFLEIGRTVKGVILDFVVSNQTSMNTREVLRFPDGNEKKQLVVTLETDERDPEQDDDDGVRRVFIKGHMLYALKQALKAQGLKTVAEGGTLVIRFASTKPSKTPGFAPSKQYEVAYKAPVAPPDAGNGTPAPAPEAAQASQGGSIEDLLTEAESVLP